MSTTSSAGPGTTPGSPPRQDAPPRDTPPNTPQAAAVNAGPARGRHKLISNRYAPGNADGSFTHRQIQVILTGLMAGMFLAALDQTIVATSIRTISDDLHGLSLQAWATTAYLITATISTPLYGKLSDIYGRRPLFLSAITIFVLGSALSAMSQTMYQLAAFRALQGLGAGGLFSLALAIIGDIVPPRERAGYQAYFLAVFGVSSVLGPVVGGFLAGQSEILGVAGWRWVFLINVPIGIGALALVARVLHLPRHRVDHRLDVWGALALFVGIVPILVVSEQGRDWGWMSTRSILCYLVAVIGLVAFVLVERSFGDEALLPLRLFGGKTFSLGSVQTLIVGMGMFGGIAMLPLYLQIVKGKSPTQAGLLLLPLTLGIMAGSVFSGQFIARTGRYKILPVVGTALLAAGLFMFSQLAYDTEMWKIMLVSTVFGLGLGGNMQPMILAIQNAVPPQDMGVATSSATFFRQMGGTLGTAVFLSLLFSTVVGNIKNAFLAVVKTPEFLSALKDPVVLKNPANVKVLTAMTSHGGTMGGTTLNDSAFINHLDARLAKPFLVGFSDSMDAVFFLGAVVVCLAFIVVLFLPEEPLRMQSGIQARMEQEEAGMAASLG